MGKLTWRPAPGPPAGPAQHRASELLAGQAGRQVLNGEHRMGATHLLAASPLPSPGDVVDRPPSLPRTPQTPPLLSSSSPSLSHAMADAIAITPSP